MGFGKFDPSCSCCGDCCSRIIENISVSMDCDEVVPETGEKTGEKSFEVNEIIPINSSLAKLHCHKFFKIGLPGGLIRITEKENDTYVNKYRYLQDLKIVFSGDIKDKISLSSDSDSILYSQHQKSIDNDGNVVFYWDDERYFTNKVVFNIEGQEDININFPGGYYFSGSDLRSELYYQLQQENNDFNVHVFKDELRFFTDSNSNPDVERLRTFFVAHECDLCPSGQTKYRLWDTELYHCWFHLYSVGNIVYLTVTGTCKQNNYDSYFCLDYHEILSNPIAVYIGTVPLNVTANCCTGDSNYLEFQLMMVPNFFYDLELLPTQENIVPFCSEPKLDSNLCNTLKHSIKTKRYTNPNDNFLNFRVKINYKESSSGSGCCKGTQTKCSHKVPGEDLKLKIDKLKLTIDNEEIIFDSKINSEDDSRVIDFQTSGCLDGSKGFLWNTAVTQPFEFPKSVILQVQKEEIEDKINYNTTIFSQSGNDNLVLTNNSTNKEVIIDFSMFNPEYPNREYTFGLTDFQKDVYIDENKIKIKNLKEGFYNFSIEIIPKENIECTAKLYLRKPFVKEETFEDTFKIADSLQNLSYDFIDTFGRVVFDEFYALDGDLTWHYGYLLRRTIDNISIKTRYLDGVLQGKYIVSYRHIIYPISYYNGHLVINQTTNWYSYQGLTSNLIGKNTFNTKPICFDDLTGINFKDRVLCQRIKPIGITGPSGQPIPTMQNAGYVVYYVNEITPSFSITSYAIPKTCHTLTLGGNNMNVDQQQLPSYPYLIFNLTTFFPNFYNLDSDWFPLEEIYEKDTISTEPYWINDYTKSQDLDGYPINIELVEPGGSFTAYPKGSKYVRFNFNFIKIPFKVEILNA